MAYSDLLIWQYRQKTKAKATIEAIDSVFEDCRALALNFPEVLDLDTATGKNLDLIGQHIGQNRLVKYTDFTNNVRIFGFSGLTPHEDGFTYQEEVGGRFFTYGINATSAQLGDDVYRAILKAKALKNHQTGSIENLYSALKVIFTHGFSIEDEGDMGASLVFDERHFGKLALDICAQLDILPRPIGVQYRYKVSFNLTQEGFFGFEGSSQKVGFGNAFDRLKSVNQDDIESLISGFGASAKIISHGKTNYLIVDYKHAESVMNALKDLLKGHTQQ